MTYVVPPGLTPAELEALVDSLMKLRVLHYVLFACITVSISRDFTSRATIDRHLQMCVWDWILTLSDEMRMSRSKCGQRRALTLVLCVYMILR